LDHEGHGGHEEDAGEQIRIPKNHPPPTPKNITADEKDARAPEEKTRSNGRTREDLGWRLGPPHNRRKQRGLAPFTPGPFSAGLRSRTGNAAEVGEGPHRGLRRV